MKAPVVAGVLLALGAAVTFGVTTPFVSALGAGVGPFTTAALLYAGAALLSAATLPLLRKSGRSFARADLPWLVGVAALGAGVAPVLLAWGVQRTGGAIASLALNGEAVFTIALAWLVHREAAGARVIIGALAMIVGGALLVLDAFGRPSLGALGLGAVLVATLAWAGDNTLTRRLSEIDPARVVLGKGALGAAVTGALALAVGEPLPPLAPALGLLACGATGYGLSLRLYLLAQRRFGAGRTASVFAVAPFIGTAISFAMGERVGGIGFFVGAAMFALGVYLHATERHAHLHHHPALAHEHGHRHDDRHHEHVHHPPVEGEHTHPHRHEPSTHEHEHVPDEHHHHGHA